MKKIKKYVAMLLGICMVIGSNGFSAIAADPTYIQENTEVIVVDDDVVATEMDADSQLLMDYLVMGERYIEHTGSQYVMVGFTGGVTPDKATVYYTNETTGDAYSKDAEYLDSETALFTMDITEDYADGKYTVTKVDFVFGELTTSVDVSATGMEASFGVGVDIETTPDGALVEEEFAADVTFTNADGEIYVTDNLASVESQEASLVEEFVQDFYADGELVVMIDPGHGGYDSGAYKEWNGVAYCERDLNLKISEYCKEELEKNGVKVYMTRTTNAEDPGLSDGTRVNMAKEVNADLFVSIHNNSAGSTSPNGTEVYYPNDNYRPDLGERGEALAEKIIAKLTALGLNDRGIHYRNSSDYTYEDGSTADYYAVIRQCKNAGILGVLIEHAYISNQADCEKYLGSEDALKQLGVADAKAILEYFAEYPPYDYKNGDASVAAVHEGSGKYTLMAAGVPSAYKVEFDITNVSTKETKTYSSFRSSDIWFSTFSVNDFAKLGKFSVDAYVVLGNGDRTKVGSTSIDVSGPSGGTITVKNQNNSSGTFDVIISGIYAPAGIEKIEVPVWSKDDLSNLKWYVASLQSDGTYKVTVDLANHGYLNGTYAIQTYVTDKMGVRVNTATKLHKITQAGPAVDAFDADGQKTFILTLTNVPKPATVTAVKFGVWKDGLSDLKWYEGCKDEYGRWITCVPVSDYQKMGTHYSDVYVYYSDGTSKMIGSTSFNVNAPYAKSITVKNMNKSAGTFDVVVSGIVCPSGVAQVRVPVWSKSDLSDLYWYTATKQKDGSYVAKANIKNHNYNYGTYAAQAYIKGENGIEDQSVSTCFKFDMPKASVWSFDAGNKENYILVAENVPYGDKVTGVRFGVWPKATSDLRWFECVKDEFGRWIVVVPYGAYSKEGKFYAHAYATLSDGTSVMIGETGFEFVKPATPAPETEQVSEGITIKNASVNNGTFDVFIGVNSNTEVKEIKVPAWTASDLSDIHYYTAEKVKDGVYKVQVNITNHKYNFGVYAVQIFVTDKDGVETMPYSTCYNFEQTEASMYKIMGESSTTVEQMVAYYNANATYPAFYATSDAPTIEAFCQIYLEECAAEGVKAEVAFCQAMKETGYLRYGGDVKIEQFNFAGLGATGGGVAGATFANVREGIRAQVQHLKAYGSKDALVNPCVDPRFQHVTRGTATYVEWLGIKENPQGKGWAAAEDYGYSLRYLYIKKLLSY
ncbi:MAG: hypothetical protein E7259_04415 [Lachnospiraceae bacterium]|nr:hypothetical protein [Lachnospiraceae bacterium]